MIEQKEEQKEEQPEWQEHKQTQLIPLEEKEQEKPKKGVNLDTVLLVLVILLTAGVLILGIPLIRDWVLDPVLGWVFDLTGYNLKKWLQDKAHKQLVSSWIDFIRIVCEVLLGLFVSNVVFNDSIRRTVEDWAKNLEKVLNENIPNKIQESIKFNNPLTRIRQYISDIYLYVFLTKSFKKIITDSYEVYIIINKLRDDIKFGFPFFLFRLLLLQVVLLFASLFNSRAYKLIAFGLFLVVLLTKVLKLYLDSPVFFIP